uniref:Uncharacterized protein n=1 Tax=Triticum urartu TaxID=4572 RepID=A0A8R7JW35_TRIUA
GRRLGDLDVDGGGAGEQAAEDGPHRAARRLLQPPHHGAPLLLPPPLPPPVAAAGRSPAAPVLIPPGVLASTAARAAERASGVGPAAAAPVREEAGEDGGALPDAAEARHGALGHGLLPRREGVAAEVHLAARVAVHHPRAVSTNIDASPAAHAGAAAAVAPGGSGSGAVRVLAVAPRHGDGPDELGVGLGPLVEADVAGPHRHARVHAPDRRLAPARHGSR